MLLLAISQLLIKATSMACLESSLAAFLLGNDSNEVALPLCETNYFSTPFLSIEAVLL